MKQSLKYHKILSLYKRNMEGDKKFIIGEWSTPELDYLRDNVWVFTEKVDGTNIRVMWNGEAVVLGGKTDNAQLYMPLVQRLQEMFEGTINKKKLKDIFEDATEVCLYGEGYGAKIQKSGGNYRADGVDFVLFDIKIGDWWLKREDVEDIAVKLGIKVVPIIGKGTLMDAVAVIKEGLKSQWGEFDAEGIVARPSTELVMRNGDRVITKVKARDFPKG